MRKTLLLKYLICFFGIILSLFVILNTYGVNQMFHSMMDEKKAALYRESELISSQYAANYFVKDLSSADLRKQLVATSTLTGTRIWITNAKGELVVDTSKPLINAPLNVQTIDPNIFSYSTRSGVLYPEYFDSPMLMAVNNIVVNYEIKGYVVVFLPESKVTEDTIQIADVINVVLLVFLLLLSCILASLYLFTIRPLHKIIQAARRYSSGQYDEPIQINTHDEFQDLADAINYMASEITSLDEYQKKFVANISHDFRSPLTSIKGYAEAIVDGTIPYEIQNKYLEIILFETERLTKLTSNLLTLNSFERNGAMLTIVSFDINQVIKKTVQSFEGICTKKKITINLIFSGKELFVSADIDKIQQVLYNLIDNAIKFSPSNSTIRIATSEKNEKAFIAIKDHGIGIPKDSIQKVWERFYKTDASRGKDKKGTGLGLSITKEIINAHGENINVVSTEGVGTEFIFSLPLTE